MKEINLKKEIKENQENNKRIIPIAYSYKEKRDKILNKFEKEKFKDCLKEIKNSSMENIDVLKIKTIENLRKNGFEVFEAKDAKSAINKIKEIIGKEKLIVKAKSITSNEISLKKELKNKEIVETDLGDFIVQVFGKEGIHPVTPALNLSPEEISKKINKKFNVSIKPIPEEILKFVRKYLREKIFKAKIGISGANVISSDGSVFILENEGNISLVSRIPDKHIILAGFDKIVETREDALKIVEAAGIFASGQEYPVYVNIISGPSKTADIEKKLIKGAQGAKEVHIILLDNKRTEILNSEFKELLNCINCGACVNLCPVYHQLFSRYGNKYFPGAKGVISCFFNESEEKSYSSGAFFCTTCKQCSENCPVKIDLSGLIKKLRLRLIEKGIEPDSSLEMIENIKKHGNPFGKIDDSKTPDKLYCC